ncbi:MAG: hypothetical protein ACOC80_00670 [Petrotogales bacterium]
MVYEEAFNSLTDLMLFKAIDVMYYTAWGPWWVVVVFMMIVTAGYISNRSEAIAAVAIMIGSAYLIGGFTVRKLEIVTQWLPYTVLIILLGIVLYRVYMKKDEG